MLNEEANKFFYREGPFYFRASPFFIRKGYPILIRIRVFTVVKDSAFC